MYIRSLFTGKFTFFFPFLGPCCCCAGTVAIYLDPSRLDNLLFHFVFRTFRFSVFGDAEELLGKGMAAKENTDRWKTGKSKFSSTQLFYRVIFPNRENGTATTLQRKLIAYTYLFYYFNLITYIHVCTYFIN